MPVDASIYSQVGRQSVQPLNPLDAMANAYKAQDMQADSQIKQQGLLDDRASRQAMIQSGGNQNRLLELYTQGGLGRQADALRKQMADAEASKADIAQKSAATQKTLSEAEALKIGQHADILSQVQTPEQAMMWAKMGLDAGILKPQQYEMALTNINKLQDPQSFEAWKQQAALGARKYIELNKPTFQNQNLGGSMRTLSLPGLGGAPQVVSSAPITQSADSIASQQTQMRGQNMVDARARDQMSQSQKQFDARQAASQTPNNKPLPPGALKMQQEALDAIGVSSSINADLGAVEQQIENGKLKFGPVSNLVNRGMNAAGMSSEESRNFGSFNSTLERLRNESLRLNTGVQTDGDAQRAWSELFQNINDTGLVKQRLKEIKNINKRGAELQQLKIDQVRGNYGLGPLDSSGQRNVEPALNSGGNTVQTPDGQVLTFPNKAAADAFKKAAGL